MELVREILLKLEAESKAYCRLTPEHFPEYDPEMVLFHFEIMHAAGLIHAFFHRGPMGMRMGYAESITWQGFDFLDAARNDTIWKRAKDTIVKHGGAYSLELLKEMLKTYAFDYFREIGVLKP